MFYFCAGLVAHKTAWVPARLPLLAVDMNSPSMFTSGSMPFSFDDISASHSAPPNLIGGCPAGQSSLTSTAAYSYTGTPKASAESFFPTFSDTSFASSFAYPSFGKESHAYGGAFQSRQPANSKQPPFWSPELGDAYSFTDYLVDLQLWCSCTEVPVQRQAGLIVLSTAGAARFILKDLSQDLLVNGRTCDLNDGAGMVPHSGVEIVLYILKREFEPEEQERTLQTIATFFEI